MSPEIVRAHVLVSGRVQGVFFRASAARRARQLGVGGWVRNMPDGRVELTAEGEREAVDALVAWARTGPPHARVDECEIRWEAPSGTDQGFFTIS